MSLKLSETNKETIRQVFNLHAKDGRLNKEGLEEIFKMIGYNITQDQLEDMKNTLFSKQKELISFNDFLKLFSLQLTDLTTHDIKAAFKVLAKDNDKYIPLALIKKIIEENSGLNESDAFFLINQIMQHSNGNGEVNYVDLLNSFTIN